MLKIKIQLDIEEQQQDEVGDSVHTNCLKNKIWNHKIFISLSLVELTVEPRLPCPTPARSSFNRPQGCSQFTSVLFLLRCFVDSYARDMMVGIDPKWPTAVQGEGGAASLIKK